jgi:thiol-disulfide isomerase/thioredoxin
MSDKNNKTFTQKILGWIGYFVLIGAILYFFAPPSWWQFGVTAVENRKVTADFSLNLMETDEKWNFADKRGKVLLVNYWATWCGPCRFETPGLVNISNKFDKDELEVVGVTVDEDLSRVPPFIKEYKVTYPILLPGNDPHIGAGGMKLPTSFLYDKKGRLAKKYTGIVLESTLGSDIKVLLEE